MMTRAALGLALALALSFTALLGAGGRRAAAQALNVALVGQTGGATLAVAAQGGRAYVGVGPRLAVMDLSDPARPALMGWTPPAHHMVRGVTVVDNLAYVACEFGGLRIVDVADPYNPLDVGGLDTPGWAQSVAVAGGLAYIADGHKGLFVVDVSDPLRPRQVVSYTTAGDVRGVALAGSVAYLAEGESGVRALDISQPYAPRELGLLNTPGWALDVAVAGNLAYVADEVGGLRVVNISDPTRMVALGALVGREMRPLRVVVTGGRAYVVNGAHGGLEVVDLSNPAAPRALGRYTAEGATQAVAVAGSVAYLACQGTGLYAVDVSNPAAPRALGRIAFAEPVDVAVAGSYAFTAAEGAMLRAIDISLPSSPLEVGRVAAPVGASGLALSGGVALLAGGYEGGLAVMDISDPAHPRQVGHCDAPGQAEGVAVAGNLAYLAAGHAGLHVIDIANLARPRLISSYAPRVPAWVYDVAVVGQLAYVAAGEGGLRVVDVSNPFALQEIGAIRLAGTAQGVTVAGNLAYVAASEGGLRVVDISDPVAPRELGYYVTPMRARAVAVVGTTIYVAASLGGLIVLEGLMPTNPYEIGYYDTPGEARAVVASGELAYVADREGGLAVLRYTTPVPTPTPTATPWPSPTPGLPPASVVISYCASEEDLIFRVDGDAFYGYEGDVASDSPLRRIPSPPAPQGWNLPAFAPDGAWQPARAVWWDSWSEPRWGPLIAGCRTIGLANEYGVPHGDDGATHLIRRTFTLAPPYPGWRIGRATLAMWSDNKTEWWWQGVSVMRDREGYGGEVELWPRHVASQGGVYTLAIQNSNDRGHAINPQGTSYRLTVTWLPPHLVQYLPVILK